jgi:HEAT repeat protein
VLARLPEETDKWARVYLCQAVLKLRVQKAVDPLIEWLGEEDGDIRLAAYESLKKLSGQDFGVKKEAWQQWRKSQNE